MNINEILSSYRNGESLSNEDLTKLYNEAKESYYNGIEIMPDFEFDELENKLGLTNKSYIGTKHNPKYTVKHPFIMGSLSKVQIHKNENDTINWQENFNKIMNFIPGDNTPVIVTPKFDGCSFEATINSGKVLTVSSRGDGYWGKDYKQHLEKQITDAVKNLDNTTTFVLRGEVLISKFKFASKYSEFVNPRSFVSGILNRDWTKDIKEICDDLSIIIYDIRVDDEGNWIDYDWIDFKEVSNVGLGYISEEYLPQFYMNNCHIYNEKILELIYNRFENYRNICNFALDGIVIKPISSVRVNNITEDRPEDCVAIKFIPMLEETTVIDIVWKLGKSGEYCPVVVTEPVIMDGKSVTRAKANNIGYLLNNKISIGTKLVFSLAGDIIPFIYKVTNTDNFNENALNLPEGNTIIDGVHLIAVLSDKEKRIEELRNSILTLDIDGIGSAGANTIVEYIENDCEGDEFFGIESKEIPNNIFLITSEKIEKALGGKIGSNVKKAYDNILKTLDLKTVIRSCNFHLCGEKVAIQIAAYLIGENYDFSSMARESYEWCMNAESKEMIHLNNILSFIGYSIDDFKKMHEDYKNSAEYKSKAEQIPVILTGEPNDYKTKGEFLKCHPEYRMTGSWKEVKIVFTNDLNSKTGKMKKALEKGIEIRVY